jgi:hypothetical protein
VCVLLSSHVYSVRKGVVVVVFFLVAKCNSVITVQRAFKFVFNKGPPHENDIRRWSCHPTIDNIQSYTHLLWE